MNTSAILLSLSPTRYVQEEIQSFFNTSSSFFEIHSSRFVLYLSSPFSHIISTAENEHVFLYLNSYPLFTTLSIINPIYKIWKFYFTKHSKLSKCMRSSHVLANQRPFIVMMLIDDSLSITETINSAFADPPLQLTQQEQSTISQSLESSIENTFTITVSTPPLNETPSHRETPYQKETPSHRETPYQKETPSHRETPFRRPPSKLSSQGSDLQWKPLSSIEEVKETRFCGQVFDSFLLFESTTHLFLIDQHAAHERVNLDFYLSELKANPDSVIARDPIHARPIALTTKQYTTLQQHRDLLSFWKWDIDLHARQRITIRTIPLIDGFALTTDDLKEYLGEIAGEAVRQEEYARFAPPAVKRLLAQRACKNAVKFNTPLEAQTAKDIVNHLMECALPLVCAHGRPTVLALDKR
ncbi:hypothetical protein WA577_000195, partial [Blastocystis sp. JDR]